jgi:hypothetical protein
LLDFPFDFARSFPANYSEFPNSRARLHLPSAMMFLRCSLTVATVTWNSSAPGSATAFRPRNGTQPSSGRLRSGTKRFRRLAMRAHWLGAAGSLAFGSIVPSCGPSHPRHAGPRGAIGAFRKIRRPFSSSWTRNWQGGFDRARARSTWEARCVDLNGMAANTLGQDMDLSRSRPTWKSAWGPNEVRIAVP